MVRKIIALACLLCALCAPAQAQKWLYKNVVVAPGDALSWVNMRAEPSADAQIYALYFSGAKLSVTQEPHNGWVKVRSEQYEGYMREEYLELDDGSAEVVPGMPIVTLKRDTRVSENVVLEAGTRLLVHGMMVLGSSSKAGLYEVTDGWHYMQVPPEDVTPQIDLANRSAETAHTGYVPP